MEPSDGKRKHASPYPSPRPDSIIEERRIPSPDPDTHWCMTLNDVVPDENKNIHHQHRRHQRQKPETFTKNFDLAPPASDDVPSRSPSPKSRKNLMFTYEDYEAVMEPKNVTKKQPAQEEKPSEPLPATDIDENELLKKWNISSSIEDEENIEDILFRVTTTNKPFGGNKNNNKNTVRINDHIFEQYTDRSSRINRLNERLKSEELFPICGDLPKDAPRSATKVRFVIESPSSSTPDLDVDDGGASYQNFIRRQFSGQIKLRDFRDDTIDDSDMPNLEAEVSEVKDAEELIPLLSNENEAIDDARDDEEVRDILNSKEPIEEENLDPAIDVAMNKEFIEEEKFVPVIDILKYEELIAEEKLVPAIDVLKNEELLEEEKPSTTIDRQRNEFLENFLTESDSKQIKQGKVESSTSSPPSKVLMKCEVLNELLTNFDNIKLKSIGMSKETIMTKELKISTSTNNIENLTKEAEVDKSKEIIAKENVVKPDKNIDPRKMTFIVLDEVKSSDASKKLDSDDKCFVKTIKQKTEIAPVAPGRVKNFVKYYEIQTELKTLENEMDTSKVSPKVNRKTKKSKLKNSSKNKEPTVDELVLKQNKEKIEKRKQIIEEPVLDELTSERNEKMIEIGERNSESKIIRERHKPKKVQELKVKEEKILEDLEKEKPLTIKQRYPPVKDQQLVELEQYHKRYRDKIVEREPLPCSEVDKLSSRSKVGTKAKYAREEKKDQEDEGTFSSFIGGIKTKIKKKVVSAKNDGQYSDSKQNNDQLLCIEVRFILK